MIDFLKYTGLLKVKFLSALIIISICAPMPVRAAEDKDSADTVLQAYQEYRRRLDGISKTEDIASYGFQVIDEHVFPLTMKSYGEVYLIPALDQEYDRLALFWAREDGSVIYKTDQLATNNRNRGELKQPNKGMAAVSFQDMNEDGLMDIILITNCIKDDKTTYKVGDVLFQNERGFYQDYRLSDKINRFSMNKSVQVIASFVRDGYSTEFLYTATTLDGLLKHGFNIASDQSDWIWFEKLGTLRLVPGTCRMAEYTVFMIYLVNEQGNIVWSFQPMGDYENLYELKGVTCQDIDGDGLKDIVVLARYSSGGDRDVPVIGIDYSVYYQRTGGFYEDTDIKNQLTCEEDGTLAELVEKARAYWGWSLGDD